MLTEFISRAPTGASYKHVSRCDSWFLPQSKPEQGLRSRKAPTWGNRKSGQFTLESTCAGAFYTLPLVGNNHSPSSNSSSLHTLFMEVRLFHPRPSGISLTVRRQLSKLYSRKGIRYTAKATWMEIYAGLAYGLGSCLPSRSIGFESLIPLQLPKGTNRSNCTETMISEYPE